MMNDQKEIPRSRIRSWVIDQQSHYAKVIIIKHKDLRNWIDVIERHRKAIEEFLEESGYIIIDDEGGKP